ncbi:MAG: hypothetical protein H0V04_01215 [Chloroflexi bacterium]|nr:hypothetical protein [Chloroflexota bacterium]HEV8054342.1 ribbon-helix-helix domain-containing protein [Candidatus Limnocylindrales bacterium]
MARTNLTLPQELLHEVDELAGPRGRSAFVSEAVAAKVKRERLRRTLERTRGALAGTPGWMDPDESYVWVRAQREPEDEAAD